MDEYVSKQAVFDWFCSNADTDGCVDMLKNGGFCKKNCRGCESGKEIDAIPAADVRPVVHGKWIMNDDSKTVCSLCGNVVAFVSHPDKRWDFGYFCPNCGADMREKPAE